MRKVYRDNGLKASVTHFVDDIACRRTNGQISRSRVREPRLCRNWQSPVCRCCCDCRSPQPRKNHQVSNAAAFAQITGNCWLNEDRWEPDALREKITLLFSKQSSKLEKGMHPSASAGFCEARRDRQTLVADCEAIVEPGEMHGTAIAAKKLTSLAVVNYASLVLVTLN